MPDYQACIQPGALNTIRIQPTYSERHATVNIAKGGRLPRNNVTCSTR